MSSAAPASSNPPPRSPVAMAWANMTVAVVQAALIAGFGFALKDRLDVALKERQTEVQERQATVAAVERIMNLVKEFEATREDDARGRQRIAMHLALFGLDGVTPLLMLALNDKAGPHDALFGLRVMAPQHKPAVCRALGGALDLPKEFLGPRLGPIENLRNAIDCKSLERTS